MQFGIVKSVEELVPTSLAPSLHFGRRFFANEKEKGEDTNCYFWNFKSQMGVWPPHNRRRFPIWRRP